MTGLPQAAEAPGGPKGAAAAPAQPPQQQPRGTAGQGEPGRRPLRILCLHGFRQTANSFAGRLHALRKRLRGVAELVFVDAPHTLPFFVKGVVEGGEQESSAAGAPEQGEEEGSPGAAQPQAQEQEGTYVQEQPGQPHQKPRQRQHQRTPISSQQQGEAHGVVTNTKQHQLPQVAASAGGQAPLLHLARPGAPKRAWLVSPDLYRTQAPDPLQQPHEQHLQSSSQPHQLGCHVQQHTSQPRVAHCQQQGLVEGVQQQRHWQAAPAYVDERQYLSQTEGWGESWAVLQEAVHSLGPFDGVLGFSQVRVRDFNGGRGRAQLDA